MNELVARCIGGIVPPIATPLTEEGQVDEASLLRLRNHLLRGGASGLFAIGSTGEGAYLTDAKARQVVRALSDVKRGEALFLGLVERTAERVVDLADRLLTDEVDAVVVTGPFYARASDAEILAHFEHVAACVPRPVLAYNIPVNVGYELPTPVIIDLLDRGVIAGLKDTSTGTEGLREVVTAARPGDPHAYFTGSDAGLEQALAVGANGAVAGLANLVPALFVEAIRGHRQGDGHVVSRAQERIRHLTRLYDPTGRESGINSTQLGSIKTALKLMGLIATDQVSWPMRRSSPARIDYVRSVLNESGIETTSAPATTGRS